PNVVAEGGANFWDAFRLIPVGEAFWHDGVRLETFPVRHHWPDTAFGLRLRGSLAWTGDTRPIPEELAKFAGAGERVAHDCALQGNPSHSGIDDLEREYPVELLSRCVLYHYAHADADALALRGYHVAQPGECLPLPDPKPLTLQST
ncbi:MAG: fold metallo-hydrolase, partial [Xanthomonadaceae bacterium]|nr:fold metallo-hydrolase [Xanthomonadaceae bacterium]